MSLSRLNLKRHMKPILGMLIIIFLIVVSMSIYANRYGYINVTAKTSDGCGGACHGTGLTSSVTLDITSGTGSYTVEPNSTTDFTIHINYSAIPLKSKSGINIAVKNVLNGSVDIGTLIPGPGLQLSFSELTHIQPFDHLQGVTTITFQWRAPTEEGTYYLQAVGLAADNNGNADANDLWNWLNAQPIRVVKPSTLSIISPNGAEEWGANTDHDITWSSSGFANVKIDLSSDGGVTFPTVINAGVIASGGSWTWHIPSNQPTGDKHRIRLSDQAYPGTQSTSAGNFIIDGPPTILVQPQPQSVCQNDSATFFIESIGIGKAYSWQKGNVAIPNTNSQTFTIHNASPMDNGIYSCVVTGSFGDPTTSSTATLYVTAIPQVTLSPANQTILQNNPVTLSVQADGEGLHYKWQKDGIAIPGQTNASMIISSVKSSDAGLYDCILWNNCGSDTSGQARLTVTLNGAALVLKQQTVNFDTVFVNKTKELLINGLVINAGSKTLNVSAMNLLGVNAADFSIIEGNAPFSINASDSHNVRFRFAPLERGTKTASIAFTDDANSNAQLSLSGFAAEIVLNSQTSVNFDTVYFDKPKTIPILVQNTGNIFAKVTAANFTGTDSLKFELIDPVVPFIIQADSTREIKVLFSPKKKGQYFAALNLTVENMTNFHTVQLTGFGDNPLGVDETNILNSFKIYPNPSNDGMSIMFPNKGINAIEVQIIDVLGNLIKQISAFSETGIITWDACDYTGNKVPAGSYIVKISCDGKIYKSEIRIVK